VLVLLLLDFCHYLEVNALVFKAIAPDLPHVVQLGLVGLFGPLIFNSKVLKLSLNLLICLVNFLTFAVLFILLSSDLHQLTSGSVVTALQGLQISPFLKQGLRCSSALLLKDMLAVQVGTFSSLHKLVSVVLISDLEMLQGVVESLYFLFALANLAVKFISKSLQFFLLLTSLYNVVSLAVLSGCLNLARA